MDTDPDEKHGTKSVAKVRALKAAGKYSHQATKSQLRLGYNTPALVCKPSSSQHVIALELVHRLDDLQFGEVWLGLVPARIGHNRSVDLATHAIIKAQNFIANKCIATQIESVRTYVDAITSLRSTLTTGKSSDEAVLSVALLGVYEAILGTALQSMFSHSHGLSKILMSTSRSTEVTSLLLFGRWTVTFLPPCALGTASRFDRDEFLNVEPHRMFGLPAYATRLLKFSHQLFIRLPRLISYVRGLREGITIQLSSTVIALANELLLLSGNESESECLHCVRVAKTQNRADAQIVPVSFHFQTHEHFKAAVYYWQTRMFLLRLCIRLQAIYPEPQYFDLTFLKAESGRMASNLLMSSEYAIASGTFGSVRAGLGAMSFSMAWFALWGFLRDVPKFRDIPSTQVRIWALQRHQDLIGGLQQLNEEKMDEAAELFVGGPLKGIIPRFMAAAR